MRITTGPVAKVIANTMLSGEAPKVATMMMKSTSTGKARMILATPESTSSTQPR